MNYANLIQNITENIKTNGSQAITAQVLQDVLVDMVGELGQSGALLGGVIDTSFVPDSTNDAQVVYIAESPGTYTNFNGLVVGAGEVAFFYFDGNAWAKSSVDVLEVVNSLTSTATDKALSAAMGKQIGDNISQLDREVTDLDVQINGISVSLDSTALTTGAYINANTGNEVANNYYSRTDFLPVNPGELISFTYRTGSDAGYALYNQNKQYVSGETDSSGLKRKKTMVVPDGVYYIRISYFASGNPNFSSFSFTGNLDGINERLETIKTGTMEIVKRESLNGDLLANQYLRGDLGTIGNPITLNGCYCILVPVKSGDKFIINGNGPTQQIALISITDESKTIVRQIYGSYRTNPQTITIGDNESYMAVNFYNYDSSIDKLIQEETYTTNQLYESIKELEQAEPGGTRNWFWKGKNVVVFGDSISEFKSSLSGDKGWTDRFVELSESNVFNGAIGGSRISARRATILPVSASETNLENSYRAYNSLDVVNLVKAWVANNWSVVDTNVAWLANNVSDDNTEQINHLKSIPVADADVVIISAGTNDWHNGSTDGADTLDNFNVEQIYGALNNIVKDILSANTKIRLYFLTPIPRYVSRGVPTFSTSEDYAVGDLVMYNSVGYVFTSAHTAGAWDSSQVRIATDLDYRRDECSSDVVQVDGRTLLTFAENEISFIHRHHLPVADMYKNIGFNKYNWSNYFPDYDNTHPYKGFIYLGERIYTIISAL